MRRAARIGMVFEALAEVHSGEQKNRNEWQTARVMRAFTPTLFRGDIVATSVRRMAAADRSKIGDLFDRFFQRIHGGSERSASW